MVDIISLKSNAERYYKRGNNASYAGKLPEAVYYLKQAVNSDRTNKSYFIDLISVFNQIGFYEDTLTYGSEALSLENLEKQDRCALFFYMGEASYCLGLNAASVRYIDLCLQEDSDSLFYKDAMLYKNELDKTMTSLERSKDDTESSGYAVIQDQIDFVDFLSQVKIGEEDAEKVYLKAEDIIKNDPININAMIYGYEAAVNLNNAFGIKRFSSMLKSIKDCNDLEMKTLCFYFTENKNDALAMDVFSSIYNGNSFWRDACFALAIAFYNTGDKNACIKALNRLSMLEGGNGIAQICLNNISMSSPPERLSYVYMPTKEQMDMLCHELFTLLDEKQFSNEKLNYVLPIVLKYADAASIGEILYMLDATNEQIKTIIQYVLFDYTVDPSKKLLLALYLWEAQPECEGCVNVMGDLVKIQDIAEKFKMRNFDVPKELEDDFGSNAVGEVYYAIPSLGIIFMDAPEEEFAFVANILLLLSNGNKVDYDVLAQKYNLSFARANDIITRMKEKGIIIDEID